MNSFSATIYGLGLVGLLIVLGQAAGAVRRTRTARAQEMLWEVVRAGEDVLSSDDPDGRRSCSWGATALARVQRLLDKELADEFARQVSILLAGAEVHDYYASARHRGVAPPSREPELAQSVRNSVLWLRRRTRMLTPRDMRGPFWWVRL
jgi:hypothetical protein